MGINLNDLPPRHRETVMAQLRYEDHRLPSHPQPQQTHGDRIHGAIPRAPGNGKRYAVRIESYRMRLCDPDNLCGKFFIDALRYAGIIPDDTAAIMDYSIRQSKAKTKAEERTEITVTELGQSVDRPAGETISNQQPKERA